VTDQRIKAARLSIVSNSILILLKLFAGIAMQSVSVISEAVHSGIDLIAAIIIFFSVRESGKPADTKHQYGHGKIENVSGIIEAILIFVAGICITVAALKKIFGKFIEIEALSMGAAVMALSAVTNWFVSRYLWKIAKKSDSIALEADALHLRTDVYTSVGVLTGLVAIHFTRLAILDPIIAMCIALLIFKAAYNLSKNAFINILDISLPQVEEKVIHEVLARYSNKLIDYHKLRTRKAGPERHIDMHLVVPKTQTVEQSHGLADEITAKIKERFAGSHVLVHIEPCDGTCDDCTVPTCQDKK